jgi:hypothetical protein
MRDPVMVAHLFSSLLAFKLTIRTRINSGHSDVAAKAVNFTLRVPDDRIHAYTTVGADGAHMTCIFVKQARNLAQQLASKLPGGHMLLRRHQS